MPVREQVEGDTASSRVQAVEIAASNRWRERREMVMLVLCHFPSPRKVG